MNKVRDLAYVRFSVPELDKQQTFLQDFGLEVNRVDDTLYARGTDESAFIYSAFQGDARFLALGIEADSAEVLAQIASIDSVEVRENPAPGGGVIAQLTDPDGYLIEVVHGMQKQSALPVPTRSKFNSGADHPRLGERVVFNKVPHPIKRLGHCVLGVTDFRVSEAWYKERFGFLTSDEVYIGDESNVLGAFMRCDRGDAYVDHHTLFLIGGGQVGFNHAAFEIADWDSLMEGHYSLQEAGYKHSWGVGKHLLGSQVFDYWKDPHGFTLEHFTDGDLINAAFGSHKAPVEQLFGSHWGPQGGPT